MACGTSCARMMLIIFNIFFWLSGLAILAVGIWMLVDDTIKDLLEFVNTGEDDNMFEYAAYILIAVGSFAVIVGFCGCCGAIKKSQVLLGLYIFFLFIVMAGELGAGILAVVYRNDIEDELEKNLNEEFNHDDSPFIMNNSDSTSFVFKTSFVQLLHFVQEELECCGIEGASDYTEGNVKVIGDRDWEYLPSCCQTHSEDLGDDPNDWVDEIEDYVVGFNNGGDCSQAGGVWPDGCFEETKDWFNGKAYILIGVGIGIACLEIFGFIFAICLCRNVDE